MVSFTLAFHCCNKIPEEKDERFIWLMIEVSVHNRGFSPWFAPFLCTEQHCGRMWQRKAVYLMATGQQRKRKELGTGYSQRHAPRTHSIQTDSTLYSFHYLLIIVLQLWTHQGINTLMRSEPSWKPKVPSLNTEALGIKPSIREPLGVYSRAKP